jgi:histidine triad (HIT) family protein
MEDCIFCKIVRGEVPSFKIYEDEKVLAFADIHPISDGHTLIVPKRHAQDLEEISEDDLAAVHLASKKVMKGLKGGIGAAGVACVQLNGKEVNQVVMHYHLHLIPRRPNDPELPVSSWELRQGDMERIRRTAEKIISAIG